MAVCTLGSGGVDLSGTVGPLVAGWTGNVVGSGRGSERLIAQTTGHKSMTVLSR